MLKAMSSITNSIGALNYVGTWNAFTNMPAIASSVGVKGDYYVVSVAGSTNINGLSNWGIGDWIVFNGSNWERVDGGADLNGVNLTITGNATIGDASTDICAINGKATFNQNTVINVTDNTNAALRITQLGTGNALVVEDSTNPDSTPFVIDASGNTLIRQTAVYTTATTGSAGLQVAAPATIGRFANDTSPNRLEFVKSRSTTVGASTVVVSGDSLGEINFQGADGTAFTQGALIAAQVDGTPGTNDMPGRLVFSTTADGASTPTERMRIDSIGQVTISNLAGAGSRAVNASATGLLSAASDSSLKEEVLGAHIAGLAEILQIHPKMYRWKDDIANRGDKAAIELGFFANDVASIIPSAAPKCNDGLYGFYDRSIIAALVKAIQEQQSIIEKMAAQITEIK